MAETDVQVCPGCGGRNLPQADTCDWCARSFSGRQRSWNLRWWQLASSLLFGSVVVAVIALSVLNASRPDSRPESRSPPEATPTPGPTSMMVEGTAVVTATLRPASTSAPTATLIVAAAPPTETPTPARYVRVFNTAGIGVNLRRDPGPQGQPIIAVPETTILRLVGPEETVQARVWRLCEHQARGVQGWVPAEYLQPTDQVPTPGRV